MNAPGEHGVATLSIHSDSVLFGHTVDAFNMVACGNTACRPDHPGNKEKYVKRAGFPMYDGILDFLAGESQPARATVEPVNVTEVASSRVSKLIKRHWLAFKALIFAGHRGHKVIDCPCDIPRETGIDIEIVLHDFVVVTIKLNRVSDDSGLYERLGGLERGFVLPAEINIRPRVSTIIGEGAEQSREVSCKGTNGVESEGNEGPTARIDSINCGSGNALQDGDDTAFADVVNNQDGSVRPVLTPVFVGQRGEGCGQHRQFQRPLGVEPDDQPSAVVTHADVPHVRNMAQNNGESIA